MGAGTSSESGLIEEEQMQPQRSSAAGVSRPASIHNTHAKSPVKQRETPMHQNNGIKTSSHKQNSKFLDGTEVVINVANTGFSENEIIISEGQVVQFIWEETTSNMNLVQVVHDGEKLRPVIGGYQANPDDCHGEYSQQFHLEGEYKFALSGIRCTPVTILVKPRMDLDARVTDDGFQPSIINIQQGHAIKWSWKNCSVPHTMQEVTFLMDRGCFKKQASTPSMVATVTGGYRHQFQRSGIYYFLSENGREVGKTDLCIVHVSEACREYKLQVLDRSFQPMILLIEEGDRVWFYWDKVQCKKSHSVYQIEAPPVGYSDEEPYVPTKDGFRWSAPSKQGLLSHQFFKAGVYYFSDQNFDEAAEYIGTIIVKPKQKEHVIELTGKGFSPDLQYAYTGDRIWWSWNGDSVTDVIETLLILEEDKCLNPGAKNKPSTPISDDLYHMLDEESAALMTKSGLATYHFTTIGVYHYRIAETDKSINTCSIIINPGSKNNTVHLTDNGFEPKVVTIRPNDRVWWVWQSCKKQHNIIQVSHQGSRIEGGFSSGQTRDSPSAFAYQFMVPGVFYFISANLPKMFGAIVVSTQPQVHEITVSGNEIRPDPVNIQTNDILCWVFRQPQLYDVCQIDSLDQLLDAQSSDSLITPRRCIGRAIDKSGSFHFLSKSFQKGKSSSKHQTKLSSIICDERCDNTLIQVDNKGFHPTKVYLKTGQSVLWSWKGTDEEHNIIHVNSPNSDTPLNVIEGVKSFNSGKLLKNNSFLYTFDEEGGVTVASQGAPGYSCNIYIKKSAKRSAEPYIKENDGGTVNRYSSVELHCDTEGADVYYTIDGTPPSLHSPSTRKYKAEKGVKLQHSGLGFVRAISVADNFIVSHIFTSKRFWILSREGDVDERPSEDSTAEEVMKDKSQVILTSKSTKDWDWLNCVPRLKGCFTGPGEMEIFWERPVESNQQLIKGYNILLNGVSYCPMFPVNNNSLNITGLAGSRVYQVIVEVYSKENHQPLKSNALNLRCPIINGEGGPVISLEIPQKEDSLSIVWMSIDSPECQVDGYTVYINDQQCGPKLVPDPNSNRCKVIIGSCVLSTPYKIYVDAIIIDSEETRMSNVIQVQLPLDTTCISLPPMDERESDDELYSEFVDIHEGSGYLPKMDDNYQQRGQVVEVETRDQSVMTDDNYKYTHKSGKGKGRRHEEEQRQHKRPPVESENSESETETDSSEWATDEEDNRFREKNVIILDAANNKATDTTDSRRRGKKKTHRSEKKKSRSPRKRFSPRKGKYIDVEGNEEDDDDDESHISGQPVSKSDRRRTRRKKTTAIVEVQQMVELDIQDSGFMEDGVQRKEQKKLAVPVSSKSNMLPVGEGEFILGDGDGILPAPSIMVESRGKKGVRVVWELPESPDPNYKLLLYVVNVVGIKFSQEINSDISFECNLVEKGKQVRGVQHCWNVQGEEKCNIRGLLPGLTYRIYVIANYTLLHGDQPCEIQTTSSVLYYTTMGPPKPPITRVVNVDFYQATLEWEPPSVHPDLKIKGYQIFVDNKPLGGLRGSDVRQMVINNMIPGKTVCSHIIAVTSKASQESDPSKTIHLTCPRRPPSPVITQQPSYKKGCVLIAWEKPEGHTHSSNDEEISCYSVYIDGVWHGEVKANKMCDKQGYQFFLTDLSPEQSYDVAVKSVSGHKRIDSEGQHVYCLSDSPMSNIVSVRAPAAPRSPKLRLEGLHPHGVDVTWQVPQQFGDASISGYQMLKNGKLYGAIIPPDVNSLKIRDVSLGEKLDLQLIALTEHPVGKSEKGSTTGSSFHGDRDSGLGGSTNPEDKGAPSTKIVYTNELIKHSKEWSQVTKDMFMGERYSGCKPGPKLVIHYTGLVQAPSQVMCEHVTGHSVLIVWNKEYGTKAHYVTPDSYQVTWWPGNKPQDDINSDSTTEDNFLITNLKPSTTYTIIVEARKMEKYTDIDEVSYNNETPDGLNAFILTSKSDQISVTTASPPNPPRNIGVTATTCNSLTVAWDPPEEHGVEVIGIRIECVSLDNKDPHYVIVDAMPDAISADVNNLHEKKDYNVRVIAITDEYFDRLPDKHRFKKTRNLAKDTLIVPEDSVWLPNTSILAKTAGTEQPTNLKIVKSSTTSMTLNWTPPLVYGSNKLQGQIVRWSDMKKRQNEDNDLVIANHVSVVATEDAITIEDLCPGAQYKIVVEAVVSIKTSLNPEKKDSGIDKYRRTAHVMSKPLLARTRAPIEPPRVLVSSYNQSQANLYWEKPPLMSVIGKDDEGKPKYLRRYLEGYKLEINGKLQCYLGPSAQSCTLTKCKAGKPYSVVLVAMTCTEEGKKSRKQKFKGFFKNVNPQDLDYAAILDDDENLDESPSEPVDVSLPKNQEGFLSNLQVAYKHQSDKDGNTFGDAEVTWKVQGQTNLIKQFSVVWYCVEDRVIQTKYISPDQRECRVPITKIKTIYNITIEPGYYTDVIPQTPQDVQVMIPGPPDAPEIFIRAVDLEEFIIEWGEPRLFGGVKVKGYQVYMNDKKVGNELSHSHRKAVIPCRQNRTYRINLVALSSNGAYGDSPKSNTLLINTSNSSPRHGGTVTIEDWSSTNDDHEIPVKVTKVMDTGIHLDWSNFIETEDIAFYKIQWSSVAQPAQREVKLSVKDSNCVINKCLPGTNHFVRLLAYSAEGQIMEKSKQMTIQTSAPPDSPVLSVRASNFRYLAIQWEKPTEYGDAMSTGYKVYVNGIVESHLASDQLSYTFTHGKWCNEYSFQVQALTSGEKMNSRVSDPLIITWPGAKAPPIHRIPSVSSSTLRVGWEEPYLTEGVKVKHFKLCCVEEDTEKLVQSVGPIHPDTREAEFNHLKKGNYSVYLETHLYGTGDVVRSDMIRMQPSLSPDSPHITVTVVGLEERRQLEKLTCDLVNKRDRLIRAVGHKLKKIGALSHPVRAEKDEDIIIGAHTLTRVEELLEECFAALEQYTGQLIAHVSWQCPQSNPDMCISSYKVLIDGKQYGNALHAGVKTVKVKLDLNEPSYRLTMVAMTDKPQGSSEESNMVELLTSPFQPFAFYCYHSIHNKEARWPNPGCCRYEDSTSYERQVAKKLANQGLLQKHVPPPACSILDIFDGEYKPLMSTHKPQFPTVVLFWTPWCQSSTRLIDHFVRFARETHKEFNFIAVTCGMSAKSANDRKNLVHLITSNGWKDDGSIWHCTSECASSMFQASNNIRRTNAGYQVDNDQEKEKQMDLVELLGIAGVPTLFFIHPEGYLAWHGRYSAFDYTAFTGFMRHTFNEVIRHPCPVYNCDCCHNNMSIDEEALGFLAHEPKNSTTKNVRIACDDSTSLMSMPGARNTSPPRNKHGVHNGHSESGNDQDRVFYRQKGSPKKKKNARISVDLRPMSAHSLPVQYHRSPYLAQVAPTSPRLARFGTRPASARKSNYYF